MVVVPAQMRGLNRRALFQRLQRLGAASRADLAKSLGMSAPTAGKIVDELLARGVLEEVEEDDRQLGARVDGAVQDARLGRPGRLVRLERQQPRFLGVDLGVRETRLAALPVDVGEGNGWSDPIRTGRSAAEWQEQLAAAAPHLPTSDYWGVLVSVPGIVDERASRVLFSPNLHWSERTDLRALIGEVWQAPVELVQEERALALGHQLSDSSGEDFLLVDFGEGVGGAIILGGRVYHSAMPISGELGHTPVRGNTRSCGCGGTGCVETLLSLGGLLQSFAQTQPESEASWEALARHIARDGVPPWLAQALEAMGIVIAGAVNVLGLRRVVITGTLTALSPAVVECLYRAVRQGAMWARFGEVVCQSAPRRRAAGLVAVGVERFVIPVSGQARP